MGPYCVRETPHPVMAQISLLCGINSPPTGISCQGPTFLVKIVCIKMQIILRFVVTYCLVSPLRPGQELAFLSIIHN